MTEKETRAFKAKRCSETIGDFTPCKTKKQSVFSKFEQLPINRQGWQNYDVAIGLRDMTLKSKKAVAYHEAGHGVAACLAHKLFRIVSILPDGESMGKCVTVEWKNFHPDYETNRRTKYRIKADIFMLLAGPCAEYKYFGGRKPTYSVEDFQDARELASYLCGSQEEADAYVEFMWEQTKNIIGLDWNWKAIEAIANALLGQKTLKYLKTRHLIQKASGKVTPSIDLL